MTVILATTLETSRWLSRSSPDIHSERSVRLQADHGGPAKSRTLRSEPTTRATWACDQPICTDGCQRARQAAFRRHAATPAAVASSANAPAVIIGCRNALV